MRASLNTELFKKNDFRSVSLTVLVEHIHAVVHLPPFLLFTLAINHPEQALTFLSSGRAFPVPSIPIFENLHNGQKLWTNSLFSSSSYSKVVLVAGIAMPARTVKGGHLSCFQSAFLGLHRLW